MVDALVLYYETRDEALDAAEDFAKQDKANWYIYFDMNADVEKYAISKADDLHSYNRGLILEMVMRYINQVNGE